ncbi:unnamed protein product [Cyprideis torosa]|uniref:Uncharacterized protein n=1 Tax=Cyprideis torosa TaxID=163714 RepID=A0A7R8W3F0_9CRUS|nr:unnamed protein product [Cyprideis torosa]CAG0879579.1 unnamed protein product [Cyprideis torosa]
MERHSMGNLQQPVAPSSPYFIPNQSRETDSFFNNLYLLNSSSCSSNPEDSLNNTTSSLLASWTQTRAVLPTDPNIQFTPGPSCSYDYNRFHGSFTPAGECLRNPQSLTTPRTPLYSGSSMKPKPESLAAADTAKRKKKRKSSSRYVRRTHLETVRNMEKILASMENSSFSLPNILMELLNFRFPTSGSSRLPRSAAGGAAGGAGSRKNVPKLKNASLSTNPARDRMDFAEEERRSEDSLHPFMSDASSSIMISQHIVPVSINIPAAREIMESMQGTAFLSPSHSPPGKSISFEDFDILSESLSTFAENSDSLRPTSQADAKRDEIGTRKQKQAFMRWMNSYDKGRKKQARPATYRPTEKQRKRRSANTGERADGCRNKNVSLLKNETEQNEQGSAENGSSETANTASPAPATSGNTGRGSKQGAAMGNVLMTGRKSKKKVTPYYPDGYFYERPKRKYVRRKPKEDRLKPGEKRKMIEDRRKAREELKRMQMKEKQLGQPSLQ